MIILHNVNETNIRIECPPSIAYELNDHFSFMANNYRFHPLYRNKIWDGKIRLFSVNKSTIYRGLASKVIEFCQERDYEVSYPDELLSTNFSVREAEEWIAEINPKHIPHEHQLSAFVHAIRNNRSIILSATSSGKSLVAYLISRYYIEQGMRGLIIVPRAALVEQLYTDFEDYSCNNGWNVSKSVHRIYSGKEKNSSKNVFISTWQSLAKMPVEWFKQFDFVICDEVHGADAKVLTGILAKCINARYRVGMTGTLSGAKCNEQTLIGLFGPVFKATTAKELMDQGKIAKAQIKCLVLKHPEDICKHLKKGTYSDEIRHLVTYEPRNRFIANLALSLPTNTLILFNYIEHGEAIFKLIQGKAGNRKVLFIDGSVPVEEREDIRQIIENETDAILVGSVGVLSTGTNITKLHNIIFATPTKSKIRTLQSLGRGLRLADGKQEMTLYDLADNLSVKKHINFTMKHFLERMRIYGEEEFKTKIYKIELKE